MAETERGGIITFKGTPMTLIGTELSVGDTALEVHTVGVGLADITPLAASEGKTRLFITVPSLDTRVCAAESKTFSEKVKSLGEDVAVFVVSADLPFAQARWCGAEGITNLTMLSDYKGLELANAWGILIKELQLLARTVYVLDKAGKVTYREIVPEVATEPDYDAAIAAVQAV